MLTLFAKFAKGLEDPDHPLMGPVIWSLNTAGMWKTDKSVFNKANIVQFFAVLCLVSEFIELWIIRADLDSALRNLSLSILSFICVVKSGTFVLWQEDWQRIIDYVAVAEKKQIQRNDKITRTIIAEYTKYSRNIMYFYWFLSYGTVLAVMLAPLVMYLTSSEHRELIRNGSIPYPELLSSWIPLDKSRGYGYLFIVVIQVAMLIYGGLTVASYDSNAIVLMSFFSGQLRILKENCKRLFEDKQDYRHTRIHECHQHHVELIKHAKIFDSVLSPVLFLYIVICSLMICTSVIPLTKEGTTTIQQLWIAEYLAALITQLFLYCWHSNQVHTMSLTVRDGVYTSEWWSQEVRVRRNISLLLGQVTKAIAFSAGPFTKLNIATFVTIIKGSYSYYTILHQK